MEEERKINDQKVDVSLFASSNRPDLYASFFKSLKGTSVKYEIVFAGNNMKKGQIWRSGLVNIFDGKYHYIDHPEFTYIETENIKPSQCYEIARRACNGETVIWVADDCEFPNDVIGKAYKYWKEQNDEKLILSIQTKETGYNLPIGKFFDMKNHSFFGFRPETPLMAPLGFMSRKFLDELGGFDRRFICGQYENQCVMMALQAGGKISVFGDKDCYIDIDHIGKSLLIGESKREQDFLNRPFAKGYHLDRKVLETSWVLLDKTISKTMLDKFEPYESKDILVKSQSNNIKEIWD
jgi:hypothetical protein